MVNLAQKTVEERLAQTILYLHDTFGENENQSHQIQLTRDELAIMIIAATESCIRLLSDFKKVEMIAISGKKNTIKDLHKLKKLAQ